MVSESGYGTYMSDPVSLKTTKKSFDIIRHLVRMEGARVNELVTELEMPKSTVHEHLSTLMDLEFVVKTRNGYRASTKFLEYGGRVRDSMRLYNIARPELQDLAEASGEHACIVIEEHGRGVILFTAEGKGPNQLVTTAGTRTRLHTNSSGKAILAHMPRERVEELIDRHGLPKMTENTVTDKEGLFGQLETIRERGYATNREERLKGMKAVAAPILDIQNNVLGAVSAYGPARRIDDERLETQLPDLVLETVNVIEVAYNYP